MTPLQYVFVFIVMMLLDVVWILNNTGAYKNAVKSVQGSDLTVNFGSAAVVYACMYAMIVLIVLPNIISTVTTKTNNGNIHKVWVCIRYGGLAGLLTYGIYNFTSYAIYTQYPLSVAIRDTLWGGTLFTLICMSYVFLFLK